MFLKIHWEFEGKTRSQRKRELCTHIFPAQGGLAVFTVDVGNGVQPCEQDPLLSWATPHVHPETQPDTTCCVYCVNVLDWCHPQADYHRAPRFKVILVRNRRSPKILTPSWKGRLYLGCLETTAETRTKANVTIFFDVINAQKFQISLILVQFWGHHYKSFCVTKTLLHIFSAWWSVGDIDWLPFKTGCHQVERQPIKIFTEWLHSYLGRSCCSHNIQSSCFGRNCDDLHLLFTLFRNHNKVTEQVHTIRLMFYISKSVLHPSRGKHFATLWTLTLEMSSSWLARWALQWMQL